jgi:hypothetical protein
MKICFSSIFGLLMAAFISFGQAPLNLPADKTLTEEYKLGLRYEKGEGVPKDFGKGGRALQKSG